MFPQATSFLEHKVVLKLDSHRILFLTEVLLFHEHTDSPIMGASVMSQVCAYVLSKTKVKTMPNRAQEHPTNRRYPLDTFRPKYQEHHGTLREQDQDIWQDQEVSTRP